MAELRRLLSACRKNCAFREIITNLKARRIRLPRKNLSKESLKGIKLFVALIEGFSKFFSLFLGGGRGKGKRRVSLTCQLGMHFSSVLFSFSSFWTKFADPLSSSVLYAIFFIQVSRFLRIRRFYREFSRLWQTTKLSRNFSLRNFIYEFRATRPSAIHRYHRRCRRRSNCAPIIEVHVTVVTNLTGPSAIYRDKLVNRTPE